MKNLRNRLSQILLSDTDSSNEEEILEINNNSSSDSELSSSPLYCNVITKDSEKEALFQLIEGIKDPQIKQEYFLKLKDLNFQRTKTSYRRAF